MDGLYSSGKTAREIVYVSNDLTVTPRADLMSPNLALVSLTLGFPGKKRINVLSFYRQWGAQTDPHTENLTCESYLVPSQATHLMS